jgi:hypothetical protein
MALELVEFPAQEMTASFKHRRLQAGHQCALAHARGAADEHQSVAAGACAVESGQQGRLRAFATHEAPGQAEALRNVMARGHEGRDAPQITPARQAMLQVAQQPMTALVARLRCLFQQPGHHIGQGRREVRYPIAQQGRAQGQLCMQQRQRVPGGEGRFAAKQLVQGGAERVEVAALVDLEIGAARLFGRQVGQGALRKTLRVGSCLVRQRAGQAEVAQLEPSGVAIHQHVLGRDVAMQQPLCMHAGDGLGQCHGQVQTLAERQLALGNEPGQVALTKALQHQHATAAGLQQRLG